MTTYAGAILPSGLRSDPAYGAAFKFLPAPLTLPYPVTAANNPPGAGAKTNNLPVAEIVSTFAGNMVRQFEQDWYHHVHLLPAKIAFAMSKISISWSTTSPTRARGGSRWLKTYASAWSVAKKRGSIRRTIDTASLWKFAVLAVIR